MALCRKCSAQVSPPRRSFCSDRCRTDYWNRISNAKRAARHDFQIPRCTIPQCEKPATSRGLCWGHYERFRRHGGPLKGGRPYGELEKFFKDTVINFTGDECLIWPYGSINGYGVMKAEGRNAYVHRLACIHRHGPPPSLEHQAAHSCGNGHLGCCNPEHLRWATPRENSQDTIFHGRRPRGEQVPAAKLSAADVKAIRASNLRPTALSRRFGVTADHVRSIQRRLSWAWLP